jgi:putative endonuclease
MFGGYMYILECANGQYYTGSTKDLERRLAEHKAGKGAKFTKKHLPVKLVYFEEFQRIDEAFYREKQVQGWSRKKKEALICGAFDDLHRLAECRNETHSRNAPFGSAQGAVGSAQGAVGSAQGAVGSAQGAVGSAQGAVGCDKGATGCDKGATGCDKGASGCDKGASGTGNGATGTGEGANDVL